MIRYARPGARFDLHLHTDRSDGRYPQEEVLERCAAAGLDFVSLTDHDFATRVAPGQHEIGGHTLQVIAGAEISGVHDGREQHLLVYFPGEVPEGFRDFCASQMASRVLRYETALDRLGLDLSAPDAAARSGDRSLTRLHLARELVERRHAADVRDAFARFLGTTHGNVPAVDTAFVDAIRIARSFGGITSWAHPNLADVRRHLATFVAAGLQGLEVLRPWLSGSDRRGLRRLAREHDLYLTGGSDWHGWRDADLGLFAVRGFEIQGFLDALEAAA